MKINNLEKQKEHFIRFIIDGIRDVSEKELEERKDVLGLNDLQSPFLVINISPQFEIIQFSVKDDFIQRYKNYIDNFLKRENIIFYTVLASNNNIICLLSTSLTINELEYKMSCLRDKLINDFNIDVFIGIGNIVTKMSEIKYSHSEAKDMLSYKYQYGLKGIISSINAKKFKYSYAFSKDIAFEKVIGSFQDGNIPLLSKRLDELIEEVRNKDNISKTSIKRTLAELIIRIFHISSNSDQNVDEILLGKDPYIWIMSQKDTPSIKKWIMTVCSTLIENRKISQLNNEKEVIIRAKDFIFKNIGNEQLGLQLISDYIGFSSSYFSQLFHNETGYGINVYINEIRIAEAKNLLVNTNLPVERIAIQLGYSSSKYFVQVFKKYVSMTPTQYRKKYSFS